VILVRSTQKKVQPNTNVRPENPGTAMLKSRTESLQNFAGPNRHPGERSERLKKRGKIIGETTNIRAERRGQKRFHPGRVPNKTKAHTA